MALESKVKWYSHAMAGIPAQSTSYSNTAGKCVELLDAVLVDGFNLVSVDSIVVNNNVATLTRSAGMTFLLDQVIEIAGATPSALNGQWRVASVSAGTNSLTFVTSGISNQTATGTITCKTPSLGWERVFTATNKRVYRSQNEDSPRSYYRIDDTVVSSNQNGGMISAYGIMTDIDTGSENWMPQSSTNPCWVIPRNYGTEFLIVGDDRTANLVLRGLWANNSITFGNVYGFGDFASFKPNDQKNEVLTSFGGSGSANGIGNSILTAIGWSTFSNGGCRIRQGVNGVSGARADGVSNIGVVLSGYGGLPFPAAVDNNIVVTDALIREEGAGGNPVRGKMRGVYWCMSNVPLATQWGPQFVSGVVGLEGRVCAVMPLIGPSSGSDFTPRTGRVLLDIYGPWE
jgi:hypothetical protein